MADDKGMVAGDRREQATPPIHPGTLEAVVRLLIAAGVQGLVQPTRKRRRRYERAGLICVFLIALVGQAHEAVGVVPSAAEHAAASYAEIVAIYNGAGKIPLCELRRPTVNAKSSAAGVHDGDSHVAWYIKGQVSRFSADQHKAPEIVMASGAQWSDWRALGNALGHNPAFNDRGLRPANVRKHVEDFRAFQADIAQDDHRPMAGDELLPSQVDALADEPSLRIPDRRQDEGKSCNSDGGNRGNVVRIAPKPSEKCAKPVHRSDLSWFGPGLIISYLVGGVIGLLAMWSLRLPKFPRQ